jgi:hypothetical protein
MSKRRVTFKCDGSYWSLTPEIFLQMQLYIRVNHSVPNITMMGARPLTHRPNRLDHASVEPNKRARPPPGTSEFRIAAAVRKSLRVTH